MAANHQYWLINGSAWLTVAAKLLAK